MAKRVILAVAGAGKTYHICHEIDPTKKNLILAYTHENIHNIQKESISTLNKLYVAMTRSCGDLYLIKSSTFKKLQDAYIKE